MKKILSAVLCAVMIITALPCAFAETVREMLEDYPTVVSIPLVKSVNVPADMEVRASGEAYGDGPVAKVESPIATTYDFKTEIDMDNVRTSFTNWMTIARAENTSDADYQTRLSNLRVKGQFVVSITYPNELIVNALDTSATAGMRGFTSIVKDASGTVLSTNDLSASSPVFAATSRVVTPGADTTNITITIEIANAGNDYVLSSELESNLDTYLADLALEMTGIMPSAHNTIAEPYYVVDGVLSGYTYIYDVVGGTEDHIGTINYNVHQEGAATTENTVSASIQVYAPSAGAENVGGGGTTKPVAEKVTVEFVSEGDTHHAITKTGKVNVNIDDIEVPEREGYAFVGWFADEGFAIPVSGEMEITENTTIYAKWVNITAPDGLNGDDRFAYIIGYPDGDVRPNANITREEIATIYYRLLTSEKRQELYTEENSFSDVEADRWSNDEISTIANGKYIVGDPDGTFRPEDAITRAEFVTIASRFLDKSSSTSYKTFTDIDGHWAEEAILSVANQEWITGYEDGSFRPDAYITRAEAMTIFNRILAHYVNENSLIEGVKHWPDNKEGAWYYYEVLSATNSRTFTFQADGYSEKWTEIVPNPDWSVIK